MGRYVALDRVLPHLKGATVAEVQHVVDTKARHAHEPVAWQSHVPAEISDYCVCMIMPLCKPSGVWCTVDVRAHPKSEAEGKSFESK